MLLCLTVVCCLHFIQSGLLAGELGRINSTTIDYEGNYRESVCMYSTESSKLDLDNLRILCILTVSTTVSLTACVEMRPFYSTQSLFFSLWFFFSFLSFCFHLSFAAVFWCLGFVCFHVCSVCSDFTCLDRPLTQSYYKCNNNSNSYNNDNRNVSIYHRHHHSDDDNNNRNVSIYRHHHHDNNNNNSRTD